MNNQKGFANIILVVVIVILVGAVGYFAFVKKSEPVAQQPTPNPTLNTQTQTPPSTNNTPAQNPPSSTTSNDFGLTVSSKIGSAPLSVSFSFPRPTDWPEVGTYSGTAYQIKLYYGDGGSDFVIPGDCHACGGAHVYASSGTYIAKLTKNNNYPTGSEELVGTATIVVK